MSDHLRNENVPGADILRDRLDSVVRRRKELLDRCNSSCKFLGGVRDFQEIHNQLSAWLTAKDRMISVLGPIASILD